ncbi:MAG: GAF domain-containing protein [Actinobacteria bacterium]|nr:GAF domain-containing protein [Actinomycetota bacterium]
MPAGTTDGGESVTGSPHGSGERGTEGARSVAQLNMLHSLAAELNSLGDVARIAGAITAELRTIVDYHNCRVYVLEDDGVTLVPVAFRGELFSEYEQETLEGLVTKVGEGITGWVAEQRTSLLTPDAREVPFSVTIPGTSEDVLESMLAVPMLVGDDVLGVIVLSKLGFGKFDEEDQRMLEVLASHAAVAVQNARLLAAEREAAETSAALLRLSQALTSVHTIEGIMQEALETVPGIMDCSAIAAYVRDEGTGAYRLTSFLGLGDRPAPDLERTEPVGADVASRFLLSLTEPFVLPKGSVEQIPTEHLLVQEVTERLVAPLSWEPEGFGVLVVSARTPDSRFSQRDLRLARGVADIASLAAGNARRLRQLERFHELVEGLDAVFWETTGDDLAFSFVSQRAQDILGAEPDTWLERSWGDQVHEDDRAEALAAFHAVAQLGDQSIEYRVTAPDGRVTWVRDLVHAVRSGQPGPSRHRGLMVDVTERKRAEQALRRSERKYSEAFRREREASQRLRALDDMKNTFLEAVSHDLRTPLTTILGSALTLEQTQLDLPKDDALDLVQRIAANARKLERLLSDLLDLDRLQRGIITPQRRPTDIEALVRRGVEESSTHWKRPIEVDVEPFVASVDAAKLERILENLLANAVRHTPEGTRIWVRAKSQEGGLLLVVEDEGPGIPADLREAVFEPFRQIPGSRWEHSPGVGVGLSLVRRFSELHGGRAWMRERPGGGSSFHVFLPGS